MQEELIRTIIEVLAAPAIEEYGKSDVASVRKEHDVTKQERDTRIALLEQKVAEHDRMMNEGNERFDRIERELKETNGLLRELVGMFKMSTRARLHTPEERPL